MEVYVDDFNKERQAHEHTRRELINLRREIDFPKIKLQQHKKCTRSDQRNVSIHPRGIYYKREKHL